MIGRAIAIGIAFLVIPTAMASADDMGGETIVIPPKPAAQKVETPRPAPAVSSQRSEPHIGLKILDAVFVRPPAVLSSTAAMALGAVAYPFVWPFGLADEMVDDIIVTGWRFTVKRPLGDFGS